MQSNRTNERSLRSAADLTQVGPGSLAGELFRQYWIPAVRSIELPTAGGPPIRLRLLGEDLIALRTGSGVVGVMSHTCPHRGASMYFGRTEADGIRCIYHGWKFDLRGACVEMPNEPSDRQFCHKVRVNAYPAIERNGVVWVYMGNRLQPPPLPELEANLIPNDEWEVIFVQRACNWLQALEGDIDTSHLGFLHLGLVSADAVDPGTFSEAVLRHRAPRYRTIDTDWGTMYGAYRPANDRQNYWRIAHYLFPFYTIPPVGQLGQHRIARVWVPLDDEHTMFVMFREKAEDRFQNDVGEFLPNSSSWLGRWRLAANRDNDYLIDRDRQRTTNYSGMVGNYLEDQAITESMGPIVDHAKEHLGSADEMIIRTRRRILAAATEVLQGHAPPGVDDPTVYRVRGGGILLDHDSDWLNDTVDLVRLGQTGGSSKDVVGGILGRSTEVGRLVEYLVALDRWEGPEVVRITTQQLLPLLMQQESSGVIVYVLPTDIEAQAARGAMKAALETCPSLVGQVCTIDECTWSAVHRLSGQARQFGRIRYQIRPVP